MNIYILFWLKSFLSVHPYAHIFKYENVKQTHCLHTFQDENKSQNIWDKLFSCKLFVTTHF